MIRFLLTHYLRRRHRRAMAADAEPRAAQEAVHRLMARALEGTRIAALHDPRVWADLDGYRWNVRRTTYDDYRVMIDEALHAGPRSHAFECGTTTAFGHSATSRNYVPFTRAHVRNFRAFQLDVVAELAIGQRCAQVLASPSLMIQGALETARTPLGILTGYSSGVMVERTPWLLKRKLLPSPGELRAPEVDARVASVGRALIERRPRVLTGMPEFVVGVLRALLAGPNEARVREALRRIEVYAWSGMPLGPYRAFFEEHLAEGCRMFDAVSATEGPIALQCDEEGLYRPALERSLLLFAPPPPGDPTERLFAWELAEGAEYDVLLGSFAGLHGYEVGDRIRVVSTRPLRFALAPRAVLADATWHLLGAGATEFCAYVDPATRALRLIVEAPLARGIVEAVVARLGASRASVKVVAAGRLAQTAVLLSLRGVAKLPRLHSRSDVQALIESVT